MTILVIEDLVPYEDDVGDPHDIHATLNWDKATEHPDLEDIRQMIDQGLSDEQIIDQIQARHQMGRHDPSDPRNIYGESIAVKRFMHLAGIKESPHSVSCSHCHGTGLEPSPETDIFPPKHSPEEDAFRIASLEDEEQNRHELGDPKF